MLMLAKQAITLFVTMGLVPTTGTSSWNGQDQIHTPGGPLEGWSEGKVKEALNNYYRSRQNAKTLEYWPFTLRSFVPWFLHDIIVKMIPTMRQHAVTWIGKTRVGKSVGSKTMLFAQSRFEIAAADRSDLVPSIVTANHLDFFKAEPLTKLKPGMFDDGLLQKMDASFLKAFLNPAAPWLHRFSVYSCLSPSCCILSSFTYQIYPCPWDSLLCSTCSQEEDATVWARYSSAQFDQGAGRHACNNPYNTQVDESIMKVALKDGKTVVSHKDFLDLIGPSFAGVEDSEDMSAILARTHLIVLTDSAVYWCLARADKGDVDFITWPSNEPRDLLTHEQKLIFQDYKANPDGHCLLPRFHEDAVRSQELIRKLLRGETSRVPSLFVDNLSLAKKHL